MECAHFPKENSAPTTCMLCGKTFHLQDELNDAINHVWDSKSNRNYVSEKFLEKEQKLPGLKSKSPINF